MKIRFGFVSNSSSSSFVVELLNGATSNPCQCCGRKDYFLRQLNDQTLEGGKSILRDFEKDYAQYNDDCALERSIANIKSAKGEVHHISIDYNDSELEEDLLNAEANGTIKILWRD